MGKNGRHGRPVVRILVGPVRPGPEPGLLTLRRRWLEERGRGRGTGALEENNYERSEEIRDGKKRLRVVCYNILADM